MWLGRIRTVAQLVGHSTIQMTMHDSHLALEHNQNAAERLVELTVPSKTRQLKEVSSR